MSRTQKVKQFVYGLGAMGGGLALLMTCADRYYNGDPSNNQKRALYNKIRSQLLAETTHSDKKPETESDQWNWPKWDYNWDRRDPTKLSETDENNNKESKPRASSRHLILVRHGQYNLDGETDTQRYLTDLGRSQASGTGMRLAELGLPYTHIIRSNMTRAIETADLIAKHLPDVKMLPAEGILREGAPIRPEPRVGNWRPDHYYFTDGARIEAAFRKHFHRAEAEQREDSYEIMVCHANVIRYFVCRALQFPPEAWLRISLKHASLTWLTIRPDGRVSIRALGEAGHLDPDMLTTS